jgi:hypothetical protein
MTYSAGTRNCVTTRNGQPSAGTSVPQNLLGGVALAGVALACGWILYANLGASRGDGDFAPTRVEVVTTRPKVARVPAEPALPPTSMVDASLLYSTDPVGFQPKTFAQSVPLKSVLQFTAPTTLRAEIPLPKDASPLPAPAARLVQVAVLPKPRPPELGSARTPSLALQAMAQREKALASVNNESIFQRFFGKPKEAAPTLAYATSDGGVFNNGQSMTSGRSLASDGQTAIYDISARTVYMPDGTKLEAHSGYGDMLDDPRHVRVKMRGATPPHVYDLTMRESLFHGVQAIRLTPVGGEGEIYGRTGLLAHTYMLGPNGDSNGCVSFKNYDAFLKAYVNNKVKRLVVVARLD